MSYLTIIVLAILIIAVVLLMKRSREATDRSAHGNAREPLSHDRDGLNRPLPGQSARTEGEVSDATRSHVGGHLEAEAAADAARESRDSGGTGGAVLAGIATAGGAAAAAGVVSAEEAATRRADGPREDESDSAQPVASPTDTDTDTVENDIADDGITNPPAPDTAGDFEPHGRHERGPVTSETHPAPEATTPAGTGERASTNAPVADDAEEHADESPTDPAADAHADAAPDPGEDITNPPVPESAGHDALRNRASGARSNAVAGTASLAVDGATTAGEARRLPNGTARLENATGANSDRDRLGSGDTRAEVREMIKILNLREGDAGRLDLSKEDFGSLWRADAGTDDSLVNEAAGRLRRMLGHGNP